MIERIIHTQLYVIIYDISNDTERNHVDELLKGYGFRIQKSVFECTLSKGQIKQIIEKLKQLELKTGFVRIYPILQQIKTVNIGIVPKEAQIDKDYSYIV